MQTRIANESLVDTVRRGLAKDPPSLPSRLLYDARGSELFEAITRTPEYYPTRAETAILRAHAAEIVGDATELVEFGSGSSAKTRLLLDVLSGKPGAAYVPIDISAEFLDDAARELRMSYPTVAIEPIAKEYFVAMEEFPRSPRKRLFAFLGSNVGNFGPGTEIQFLRAIREAMRPEAEGDGDSLLVGTDLVKDIAMLHKAYDDAGGVTAEFTLNLLRRMTAELGATLETSAWRHDARWNEDAKRMEMGLVATRPTAIMIGAETWSFDAGQRIRTEYSHKYTRESVAAMAEQAGMRLVGWWTDPDELFADSCWRRVG